MDIISLVIAWLVTSVSFFIISKLPLGVEIDSFKKAMISAAVFGLLNALVRPLFLLFTFPLVLVTFGLFAIVINQKKQIFGDGFGVCFAATRLTASFTFSKGK